MNWVQNMAEMEALLFAAGDPLSCERIASILDVTEDEVFQLADQMKRRYARDPFSGLTVRVLGDRVSLVTDPTYREIVAAFFGDMRGQKLSDAAYETLAVIAYNAPVTRAEIETVRGVNSDSVVSRLIDRGLVQEVGTLDLPGRPALLDVTSQFLLEFGLSTAKELPPVDLMMYDSVQHLISPVSEDTRESTLVRPPVIAIDGPSGSGKSTAAKGLARRLGISCLDTGAMYRALGYKALQQGISPSDESSVGAMLTETNMIIEFSSGLQKTIVDGEDMEPYIRTAEVAQAASDISTLSSVRAYCVRLQRELCERQPFVLDGRDIGTYVFPNAPYKFFLTASPEVRAKRRLQDLQRLGKDVTLESVLDDIKKRDDQDSGRVLAPAKRASDAMLIDTSDMSPEEVIDIMVDVIRQRESLKAPWERHQGASKEMKDHAEEQSND